MKIVFCLILLLFSFHAFSHTVFTGSGRGSVIQNDMKGLKAGDTLAIRSGIYELGGSFSHLKNIVIINANGVVEFKGTVLLGDLYQVQITGSGIRASFYGFRFHDFNGDAFLIQSPCRFLSLSFCEYRNLNGNVFNASRFCVTYTGDPLTRTLVQTEFRHQKLVHSGALFTGSWAANASFQNVIDSISFIDIIIDSTSSDVCQVIGHSLYHVKAQNWRVTGPCPNGVHDAGIFQIYGNAVISNVYRRNGWGYLLRIWNLGLNGRADSYLYNCIDLGTDNYGTVDTRVEAGDTTTGHHFPFVRGGSMHILNNTVGNKKTINYVSQLVIAGDFCARSGYELEIRNNLCFNTVATGADPIVKQNTSDPLTDTSNNLYVSNPITSGVLKDTIECKLQVNSPAIKRGRYIPYIKTDIDSLPRPLAGTSDIGARQFHPLSTNTYSKQNLSLNPWLGTAIGAFLVIVCVLAVRKRAFKSFKSQ